mmetsp:Transcript_82221/g.266480  ORF Transcript_82221/g.266480 Transcript_82221/m.266480 type:complete len:123 (+) Transcript_82221:56-424(+)
MPCGLKLLAALLVGCAALEAREIDSDDLVDQRPHRKLPHMEVPKLGENPIADAITGVPDVVSKKIKPIMKEGVKVLNSQVKKQRKHDKSNVQRFIKELNRGRKQLIHGKPKQAPPAAAKHEA